MEILIAIVCLAVGGFVGWRAGIFLLNKKMIEENIFLRNHVNELKETIKYWSEQSSYNKEIQNSTIINHNSNLTQTLTSIVTLLQNQNKEQMKEGEKEQIESIIKTIKGH